MTDFPDLKVKALVSFPAAVIGGTGISVSQPGGRFTFNLDYSRFPVLPSLPLANAPNNYTLSYDLVQKNFALIPSAGNRPGFSAGIAVDQTLPPLGAYTKINFASVLYNFGNYYDPTTSRFIPPAGKVRFTGSVFVSSGGVDQAQSVLAIYKNAALYRVLSGQNQSGTGTFVLNGTVDDLASGTDIYEVYVSVGGAGSSTVSASPVSSFFQAEMVG